MKTDKYLSVFLCLRFYKCLGVFFQAILKRFVSFLKFELIFKILKFSTKNSQNAQKLAFRI